MIAALKRLQGSAEPSDLPDEVKALAINAGKMSALFSSHPPLADRIAALEAMEGDCGTAAKPITTRRRSRVPSVALDTGKKGP